MTWLPFAGAAAVALLVAAAIVFAGPGKDTHVGSQTDSDEALTCPATYQQRGSSDDRSPWVPTDAIGVDGTKHLTPGARPSHVTICYYRSPEKEAAKSGEIDLTGRRTLTGGLGAAAKDLHTEAADRGGAAVCPRGPGVAGDDYLVGMTFATGLIWVSAPGNACKGSSNGDFVSSANLSRRVATAYAERAWPS